MKVFPRFSGLLAMMTAVAAVLGGIPAQGQSDAAKPDLEDLLFEYEVKKAEIDRPMTDLQRQYEGALGRLKDEMKSQGNLDAVLALEAEKKGFRAGQFVGEGDFDALKRLRDKYRDALSRAESGLEKSRAALVEASTAKLEALQARLTQEGRLDEAQAVVKALKRRQDRGWDAADASGAVLWELTGADSVTPEGDCRLAPDEGGGFRVESPEKVTWLKSNVSIKPPFRIEARVATDSTNVRFYWGKKTLAIFNWEMREDELRIHDPVTHRGFPVPGQGFLEHGEMHDIQIDVTPERVTIRADRRPRGEIEGDYAAVDSPVGIGPAFGSVLRIESLRVVRTE
ncbi:MAG: hypothetical protein H7A52_12710 [Akkermansiaceae bacterium]|nr:hypothetical protein [Akkermansiaceae bacterium]